MEDCPPDRCLNPGPRGGNCPNCYSRKYRAANLERSRVQERARAIRQRELHRDVLLERKRQQYADDPDKFKARVNGHRAANLEKLRERERLKSAKFRTEHPEVMRAYVNASMKRWRAENPEVWTLRNREYHRARRARTAGGQVDYAAILTEHGMTCHLCGDPIESLDDLHMDHVVPLILGGPHSADNIRPAHAFCNLSKGGRLIP